MISIDPTSLKYRLGALSLAVLFLGAGVFSTDIFARNVHLNRHVNVHRDVGRTKVNVNRNVNVRTHRHVDVDVHHDYHHGYHHDYHPFATAAAVTATALVVGSIVNAIPPSCSTVQVGTVVYRQCGNTWYQPQYYGNSVQYIVVSPPR